MWGKRKETHAGVKSADAEKWELEQPGPKRTRLRRPSEYCGPIIVTTQRRRLPWSYEIDGANKVSFEVDKHIKEKKCTNMLSYKIVSY